MTERTISACEIGEGVDRLQAEYWGHDWHGKPDRRLAMDLLAEAERAIRTFEDAARARARPVDAVSTLNLMVNAARGVVPPREKPVSPNRGPSLNVAGVIVAESAK